MIIRECKIYLYDKTIIKEGLIYLSQFIKDKQDAFSCIIQRGWVHGNHIKLIYSSEDDNKILMFENNLMKYLNRNIENWKKEKFHIDFKILEEMAKKIAIIENYKGEFLPLRDQFYIEFNDFEDKSDIRKNTYMREEYLKTKFYINTLEYYYDLSKSNRTIFIIKLMILFGDYDNKLILNREGTIAKSYFSFKSHYEGFKAQLNRYPKEKRIKLIERIDLLSKLEENFITDKFDCFLLSCRNNLINYEYKDKEILMNFKSIVIELIDIYESLLSENKILFNEEHSLQQFIINNKKDLSDYHKNISKKFDFEFFSSNEFLAGRMLVNWFYSMLPLFSISPLEKHRLCNMLCQGIEKNLGKNDTELINDFSTGMKGYDYDAL